MKNLIASAALLAVSAAASAGSNPFSEWNLIVRNNLDFSSSEVDGSTLIGGNLGGTSNYAVQGVTAVNGDGLAVGGFIQAGINVQINNGGNLRVTNQANILGNVNLNGGGSIIEDPGVVSLADSYVDIADFLGSQMAAFSTNGSVDGAGNMSATPTVMDGQNVAVYNIADTDLNGLGQLNLNFGSADTVIINVSAGLDGIVDLTAPPNLVGDFNQSNSSRILWNFHDATELVVNNNLNGAVFAPDADLQLLGGGINGTVVVDSLSLQQAEIRRFTYDGFLPPIPAAPAFGLFGAALLGGRRRRAA